LTVTHPESQELEPLFRFYAFNRNYWQYSLPVAIHHRSSSCDKHRAAICRTPGRGSLLFNSLDECSTVVDEQVLERTSGEYASDFVRLIA
jgi:hypothetical protein